MSAAAACVGYFLGGTIAINVRAVYVRIYLSMRDVLVYERCSGL